MESRKFHDDKAMCADEEQTPAERRGPRNGHQAGPQISLVILSGGSRDDLAATLDSVVPRCRERAIRVYVVLESEAIAREFGIGNPEVRFLMVGAGLTDGERRATGLRAAASDVVVFASDRGMHRDGWHEGIARGTGARRDLVDEPSAAWGTALTQRGVPGALGDI